MRNSLATPFLLTFFIFGIACNNASNNNDTNTGIAAPQALNYELVKVYSHDTTSYTQGLEWNNNIFIEGKIGRAHV